MHENSLEAHDRIRPHLGPWQAEVLQAIKLNQPCTRQDLVPILDKPINEITGRVSESLDKGCIEEIGKQRVNNYPRAILRAVKRDEDEGIY